MFPVSPVIEGYQKQEVIFAENQPQYLPLPALVLEGEERPVVSRWRLTDEERKKVSEGADLLLTQNIFSGHVCPHCDGKFDSLYNPIRLEVADGVWWNRSSKPADDPDTPDYLKGWWMAYCITCGSNYMYMPNDPSNRSCPRCSRGKK